MLRKCKAVKLHADTDTLGHFFRIEKVQRDPTPVELRVPEKTLAFQTHCDSFLVGPEKNGKAMVRVEYLYALRDILATIQGVAVIETPKAEETDTTSLPANLNKIDFPSPESPNFADETFECLFSLVELFCSVGVPVSSQK